MSEAVLLDRVPSTKDFATSMFEEMLNKLHQHHNLITQLLQSSRSTIKTIRNSMGPIGFFRGKDPRWWDVSF